MANSAIIFGSNGQDGYYLTKQLITLGIKVIGISRSSGDIIGNVGNYNFVSGLIKNEIPDYIKSIPKKIITPIQYHEK